MSRCYPLGDPVLNAPTQRLPQPAAATVLRLAGRWIESEINSMS
jgi:hypothetical protein